MKSRTLPAITVSPSLFDKLIDYETDLNQCYNVMLFSHKK